MRRSAAETSSSRTSVSVLFWSGRERYLRYSTSSGRLKAYFLTGRAKPPSGGQCAGHSSKDRSLRSAVIRMYITRVKSHKIVVPADMAPTKHPEPAIRDTLSVANSSQAANRDIRNQPDGGGSTMSIVGYHP